MTVNFVTETMISILLKSCVRLVVVVVMYLSIGLVPLACSQAPSLSYHHDSVYIQSQHAPYVVKDIVQHSSKDTSSHDQSISSQDEAKDPNLIVINISTGTDSGTDDFKIGTSFMGPDKIYYFAPKNPQNNKSSIMGQLLGITLYKDLLKNIPEKYQDKLDLYKIPKLNNLVLPLRASLAVPISIFNPYPETIKVVKVFGGGPGFNLKLMSGKMEDHRSVWDIMPYETKPVIQFIFSERSKKNHTTNVGLLLSNDDYINVPVNILMVSKPGLYSSDHIIDFGVASKNGLFISKAINLCNSAKSSIIVKNVTSDSHFVTVDFPNEMEIPAQTCTAGHVALVRYYWDYLGYSHGETYFGQLTVKCNKGSELYIPYQGRTLVGDLVYEEEALHFVMSKAIHSTSIIKTFSLFNNFSTTPVAISHVAIPKNATQYFKIRDFNPVVLRPGQKKTLFRVAYVNPNNVKMDLISYLEFKTNASDFTVPVMVYDGQLSQILPATNLITLPPIRISSPRHTYIVVANENPVALKIKDWGTTYTPHVTLTLVETGEFNISMRRSNADSWSRPMVRENRTPPPMVLPAKHYAIFQLLVSTPNPDQNLTVKIWIQSQHQQYSMPLKVSVFDRNLQVIAEPLMFENCHPGAVCTAEVSVMSWMDRTLALTSVTSEFVSENVRFVPTRPSLIQPQMVSLVGHIEWIPVHHKNSSSWIGLFNKAERAMWLSSLQLTNSSETSYMDFSWFYRKMGKYYAEEDNRTFKHQFTLETGGAETCQFSVHLHLKWPKFIQEPGENRQQTTFELPTIEVNGSPYYQRIVVKNTFHSQNLTLHLAMYPDPYWCNITEFIDLYEHEVNSLLSSRNDWELVLNNTSPYRRTELNVKNTVYVPQNKTMLFALPPQKEIEILVRFQPKKAGVSTSILFIRNDVSILESILLKGMGAYPVLSIGSSRKMPPFVFDFESSHMTDMICRKNKTELPSETRIFLIKNSGKHPIKITSMAINKILCKGFGFEVKECKKFVLLPNQSKEVSVEFTSDLSLRHVLRQLEITVEESVNSEIVSSDIIYHLWGIVPSEWDLCRHRYTRMEFHQGDGWYRPNWEKISHHALVIGTLILVLISYVVPIAAMHTLEHDCAVQTLGQMCDSVLNSKRSSQAALTQTTNAKKIEFKNSKHKEGNDEKRAELMPDPSSLGISQSENSYVKPSDTTPIWSFMLPSTEPEPEPEQKPEKDRSRSHLVDSQPKEKTKRRYLSQSALENDSSNQKYTNIPSWQITRNKSPALPMDSQTNKSSKVDDLKFEMENRRRADKLLKKQFGLKPVDNWRKHKKAMNAAKYFEDLPAVTEKMTMAQEAQKTFPEPKVLDTKVVKCLGKSNKKSSTVNLPSTKQTNSSVPTAAVLSSFTPDIVKKPIASVAPYQIVLPKQPAIATVQGTPQERTIEKYNMPKPKPLPFSNKIEKEHAITPRPVISKKCVSEDDGLLAEYKYMKKKNKPERKSSLPPPTPMPNVKSKVPERCTSLEVVAKTKIKDVTQPMTNKQEYLSTNKRKSESQLEVEKKVTVLNKNSDDIHIDITPAITNKHGPVGSGRDRKLEEKTTNTNTDTDLVGKLKQEPADNAATKPNVDNSADTMTFSPDDSGYNLWTSFVWGPVSVQGDKDRDPKIGT